jgi:hypothetical protein
VIARNGPPPCPMIGGAPSRPICMSWERAKKKCNASYGIAAMNSLGATLDAEAGAHQTPNGIRFPACLLPVSVWRILAKLGSDRIAPTAR